ncbi:tetratricopeptide repeat protein [Neolewinella lacunae]|uniref:Tetratricopeptide repeat protein n=1 Tax=Neolewinella lacunae TaxID=1517758 RepID=A0A923T857_9BACT|nr:tetratricopeptide repeat protein [Neolewinella lacunae]MBC6994226.1 tetratricopeptide repeat protein [Neolewinella lacunae]MDN3634615.1 tetratricopeptide repeat protein [Neolewinella lacunae]
MKENKNDQRDRALQALVARYEQKAPGQSGLFLSEEEFEDLLVHYYGNNDFDRTLEVADLAIGQHNFTPEFYKWKALIHKINLEEEAALATLEKLSIYAPNDEESLMLRLEVLTHFEKREEARNILDTLRGRVEGPERESLLAFFDGLLLLQETRYDEAWEAFREAVRLDAYQEPALDEMLNASEFDHLRSRFGAVMQEVLEADPFNDLAWYYLGLWYDDLGQEYKAVDAFANARSLDGGNPRYDLEYADKLFDIEDYETAIKVYEIYFASPEAEDTYETYMRFGRSLQLLNRIDEAKAAYFRAVEIEPDMYDIYQHLGECFAVEEKWGMAAYNYGRAVERANHTADCWLGLALCLAATNEQDDAEQAFQRAIEMDDHYSEAYVSYAIFLCDQGREKEGLGLMHDVLERYQDGSLLYGMVAIYLICNKRGRALEYLNDALSTYYDDSELLLEWYPDLRDDREINAIFELHKPR